MMKKTLSLAGALLISLTAAATNYYVATTGSDSNPGTLDLPFATLAQAQRQVVAGDTVFIRGGTYRPTQDQIMGREMNLYHCVFLMDKSGTADDCRICYIGFPGERPVFDLSAICPDEGRIAVFFVKGSYLHFRNIEVVGTRVIYMPGNTQSECFSNRGGSHNIYENLSIHDGGGIGFYLVRGSHNLVVNCDAYRNFEDVTGDHTGGNVDGFGMHPKQGDVGNVMRGCRSWWNSDDGFDLIHAFEAVSIEGCYAFYNGYCPGTFESAADGNGFKAGGYGMKAGRRWPDVIPMHRVSHCIAYHNKAGGFYANHHLGGVCFEHNSSYDNQNNYNMLCRQSAEDIVDVDGYGHILRGNVSFQPRQHHVWRLDVSRCTVSDNSFDGEGLTLSESDFLSLDPAQLMLPRLADGSLPPTPFLQPAEGGTLSGLSMGHTATDD